MSGKSGFRRARTAVAIVAAPTPTPGPTPSGIPRGTLSRLTSSAATKRTSIVTTVDGGLWTGFDLTTQTAVNSVTVTSPAALATAVQNFASTSPNVMNEVLLDDGDWTGSIQFDAGNHSAGPVFNTALGGGCLIRPKPGSNVIWTGTGIRPSGVGIHLNGITFAGGGTLNVTVLLALIPTSGSNPHKIAVTNCNFGTLFNPAKTVADKGEFGIGLYFAGAASVYAAGNTFKGLYVGQYVAGARYYRSYNNDFNLCIGFAHHNYPDADTGPVDTWTGGSFNHIVANLDRGNWLDNATDYTGDVPHREFVQFNWPPGGSGPAPVNKYSAWIEDNVLVAAVQSYIIGGGGTKLVLDTNLFLVSDANYSAVREVGIFNNICSSVGFLAQNDSPGLMYLECNTAGVPPVVRPGVADGQVAAWATITNNKSGAAASTLNSSLNIYAADTSTGGTVTKTGDVICSNAPSASVGQRPGDVFSGTFVPNASGFWVWSLNGVTTYTKDALRLAVITQLVPKASAGATFA